MINLLIRMLPILPVGKPFSESLPVRQAGFWAGAVVVAGVAHKALL